MQQPWQSLPELNEPSPQTSLPCETRTRSILGGSIGAKLGTKGWSYRRADTATRIGQTVATGLAVRLQEAVKVLEERFSTFATGASKPSPGPRSHHCVAILYSL